MVIEQLERRDIHDFRALYAMRKVPRHLFVPEDVRHKAYSDSPLPIGENQTISQPYMVALMTQLLCLKGGEKVLEIGTGSGYQTAVLAEIAGEVYSIERISSLLMHAREVLDSLGYTNITTRIFDGTYGWKEKAPFDCIIITAASPGVPLGLAEQLKTYGKMIVPVGNGENQILKRVTKSENGIEIEDICGCVFVKLIGRYGWSNNSL